MKCSACESFSQLIFHSAFLSFLQMKTNFMQLLKETTDLDRQSKWSDVKKKLDSDPRYKAVDSSSRREDWFKDYVRTLEKVRVQFQDEKFLKIERLNGCF